MASFLMKCFVFVNILIQCPLSILLNNNVSKSQITEFSLFYGFNPSYAIRGYEPIESGHYPLFMWLAGTGMDSFGPDAQIYTAQVATIGIVAVSVYYNNTHYPTTGCNALQSKAKSIFGSSINSAISILCNRNNIDCNKGVILGGFSQGSNLISMAANYDSRIRAVYEMSGGDAITGGKPDEALNGQNLSECLSFNSLSLKTSQIRSCIGRYDEVYGTTIDGIRSMQISITGTKCDSLIFDCIQNDGSGWYIVQMNECGRIPDHCYAYDLTFQCGPLFTVNYQNATSSEKWGLTANLNWLISKVD